MINIEELKEKFEKELRCAELSNELEQKLNVEPLVYSHRFMGRDIQISFKGSRVQDIVSLEAARRILSQLPRTAKVTLKTRGCEEEFDYWLELRNDYKGNSVLDIKYISGDSVVGFAVSPEIIGSSHVREVTRQFSDSEFYAYSNANNYQYFEGRVRALQWSSPLSTNYVGGNSKLWDESVIENVIDQIIHSDGNGE